MKTQTPADTATSEHIDWDAPDDDPIVAEVHRIRDELFAKFDYNADRWHEYIQKEQQRHGDRLVSYDHKAEPCDR